MRNRADEGKRREGDPSEDDAWWLSRQRAAASAPGDARTVAEELVEPVPTIEDPVPPVPSDDDEIDLREPEVVAGAELHVDEVETAATWFSLENTITLRANEARHRIADISNSARGTGVAT